MQWTIVQTMKRFLLTLFLSIFAFLAYCQSDFLVDGVYYSISIANSKTVAVVTNYKIKRGTIYSGDITIPATVSYLGQDYRVTSIRESAFIDCEGLNSITIPPSVTTIGEWAFCGCTGLTSIAISSAVTSIGNNAFGGCTASIDVDSNNTYYASLEGVLYDRKFTRLIHCPASFENEFTILPTLKTIEDFAFYRCTSLTTIIFPNSVTNIGNSAFNGCTSLTSLTIPYSVTNIGGYAFYGCTGLTSITMYASVKTIGDWAFMHCRSLATLFLPSSLTTLGGAVFTDCSAFIIVDPTNPTYSSKDGVLYDKNFTTLIQCPASLKENFIIPATVNTIQAYAFYGCEGLTSIAIPPSVNYIGNFAFSDCSSLTTVTIPSSVNSIGVCAFYGCSGLTSITIPNSVTAIGDMAFSGCTSLPSVYIPSSVNSIENDAFYRCTASICVDSNNLTYSSKDGILYDKSYKTLIQCPTSLLNSFTIPATVNKIEDYAFGSCKGLTSVTIPVTITSIGLSTFMGCTNLKTIISNISRPTNLIEHYTFGGVDTTNCLLLVPLGTSSLYKVATGWKDFRNIIEFDATELETQGSESIKIYPNPTSNFIHMDGLDMEYATLLKIYNATGKQFCEMRELNYPLQIDVSSYPSGLYFIHFTDKNNRVTTIGRFIRK